MKRVVVYVEGPSDKAAMEALLKPLLRQRRQQGIAIDFFDAPAGDRKKSLLLKIPHRAVNILCNQPATFVVTMPDLYPRNRGFPHKTYEELANGVLKKRVVEDLFRQHRQRYRDTVDAPLILSGSDYQGLAEACPQCFKPFVEFLSSIKVG